MNMTRRTRSTRAFWPALALVLVSPLVAAGSANANNTFTVTKNTYVGAQWWGTITFRNNGPAATSAYQVEFDVPSGSHCTNDYVPPGAVLSPLNGTGPSARTVGNHCIYTWNNSPLAANSSKTFNYSTDTQSFSAAANLQVSDLNQVNTCSTFQVTKNVYDGPQWWGTITFRNNGPTTSSNYTVEFDVPAGKHCTNDYVPPGAVLSPLNGTGPSARTVSNHCAYTWTNAPPLTSGASKTFNYSTDSQNFTSASNIEVHDQATCGPAACLLDHSPCVVGLGQCCSGVCGCFGESCTCIPFET